MSTPPVSSAHWGRPLGLPHLVSREGHERNTVTSRHGTKWKTSTVTGEGRKFKGKTVLFLLKFWFAVIV